MKAPSPANTSFGETSVRHYSLPMLMVLLLAVGSAHAQQQRPLTGAMAQPLTPATGTTSATAETIPLESQSVTEASSAPAAASVPPSTSPFADSTPPASPRANRREVGDVTRSLLRMQSEGTYAGAALPILGDEASRSYKRYMDSFEHPIPEKFENAVEKQSSSQ